MGVVERRNSDMVLKYADRRITLTQAERQRADATAVAQAKIDAEEATRPVRERLEMHCRITSDGEGYALGPEADRLPAGWPDLPGAIDGEIIARRDPPTLSARLRR